MSQGGGVSGTVAPVHDISSVQQFHGTATAPTTAAEPATDKGCQAERAAGQTGADIFGSTQATQTVTAVYGR